MYRSASCGLHVLHKKIISFETTPHIYCFDFSGSMRISSQLYFPRVPKNYKFQTLPFRRTCRSPLTVWRREMDKETTQHSSTKGDENGKRTTLLAVAPVTVQATFQSWKTACICSHDDVSLLMDTLAPSAPLF